MLASDDDLAVNLLAWCTVLLRHSYVTEEDENTVVCRILTETIDGNCQVIDFRMDTTLSDIHASIEKCSGARLEEEEEEGGAAQFGYFHSEEAFHKAMENGELDMCLLCREGKMRLQARWAIEMGSLIRRQPSNPNLSLSYCHAAPPPSPSS